MLSCFPILLRCMFVHTWAIEDGMRSFSMQYISSQSSWYNMAVQVPLKDHQKNHNDQNNEVNVGISKRPAWQIRNWTCVLQAYRDEVCYPNLVAFVSCEYHYCLLFDLLFFKQRHIKYFPYCCFSCWFCSFKKGNIFHNWDALFFFFFIKVAICY